MVLVVQKLDNTTQWENHYLADKNLGRNCIIHWIEIYPVDSGG